MLFFIALFAATCFVTGSILTLWNRFKAKQIVDPLVDLNEEVLPENQPDQSLPRASLQTRIKNRASSVLDNVLSVCDSNWLFIFMFFVIGYRFISSLTEGNALTILGKLSLMCMITATILLWFMILISFLVTFSSILFTAISVSCLAFVSGAAIAIIVYYFSKFLKWMRRIILIFTGLAFFLALFRLLKIAYNMYKFESLDLKSKPAEETRHALEDYGKSYIKYRVRNEHVISRNRTIINLFKKVFDTFDALLDPVLNPCWNVCMPDGYSVVERSKYRAPGGERRHSDEVKNEPALPEKEPLGDILVEAAASEEYGEPPEPMKLSWWVGSDYELYRRVDGTCFLSPKKDYPNVKEFSKIARQHGCEPFDKIFFEYPIEKLTPYDHANIKHVDQAKTTFRTKFGLNENGKPIKLDSQVIRSYAAKYLTKNVSVNPILSDDWKQSRQWLSDDEFVLRLHEFVPCKGYPKEAISKIQNSIIRSYLIETCCLPKVVTGVDDTVTSAINDAFLKYVIHPADSRRASVLAELRRNKISPTILGFFGSTIWYWDGHDVLTRDTYIVPTPVWELDWDLEFCFGCNDFSMSSSLRAQYFLNYFGATIQRDKETGRSNFYFPSDVDKWNERALRISQNSDGKPSIFNQFWVYFDKMRNSFVGCLEETSNVQRILLLGATAITLAFLGFYIYSRYFNVEDKALTRHSGKKGKTKQTSRGWTRKRRFKPMSPKEYDDRIAELTWDVQELRDAHRWADEMNEGPLYHELEGAEKELNLVLRGAKNRGYRHEGKGKTPERSDVVPVEKVNTEVQHHPAMFPVRATHKRGDNDIKYQVTVHTSTKAPSGKVMLVPKHCIEEGDSDKISLVSTKSSFNNGKRRVVEISTSFTLNKIADIGDLVAFDCPWNNIRATVLPFVVNEIYPDSQAVAARINGRVLTTEMVNMNPNSIEKRIKVSLSPGDSGTPFFFYSGNKIPDAIAGVYVAGNERRNYGVISTITKAFAEEAGLKIKTLN